MSCQLTKPSDAALQTALQAVLKKGQLSPLVPHPPGKNMAWRTRRIVAELNALKSIEAIADFEAQLRSVLSAQETRCRTKLTAAALSEECTLRERESLERDEAAERCKLTQAYYAVTGEQFDLVHVRMVEETARRALRRSERGARYTVTLCARVERLFLIESKARHAMAAQEECCREELQLRRVVEIGNDLQREIITQSRLSGHLRSVAHSHVVQEARRQMELQEDRDRSAVARLYQLHTILLFERAREDFMGTIQRDVALLSGAGRHAAQQAEAAVRTSRLCSCVEHESQIRLLVEEQEAAQFKTLAQGFLLGWRTVYKTITKDPDVLAAFSKVELVVRREIADQERRAFGALQLASECRIATLERQRAERRSLCQDYVAGAQSIWKEESGLANALFRMHHRQLKEADALQAVTVLATAEAAARRGVYGSEAQSRLTLKIKYASASVLLRCAEETQRIMTEEASEFDYLQYRYLGNFHRQQVDALAMAERAARMLIERDESSAAADTFLALRQSLAHFRATDATRPLLLVEAEFRRQVAQEEFSELHVLSLQHCRLTELVGRWQLKVEERTKRHNVSVTQLSDAEEGVRRELCHTAFEQLTLLRSELLAAMEDLGNGDEDLRQVDGGSTCGSGTVSNENAVEVREPRQSSDDWTLPECVEQAWSGMYADWELTDNASSTVSLTSRKMSALPLLHFYAAQCEEVLTDAYLERDLIHFTEHTVWRRLMRHFRVTQKDNVLPVTPVWKLHSISLKQEPNQRASSVNMWDSNQVFDVSFSLAQKQEEAIVGESTIAFYVPYDSSAAAVLPRCATPGMVFFLVLDEEGTVLSSATLVMETGCEDCSCLCVALNNSAGYLRFE